MAVLIADPAVSGKLEPFSRLISAGNSCTSQSMSDEAAILAANAAYYRAFTSADFAAMSRIWADDNVSCIHPGWLVLLGRQAILESYREILRNPDQERIEPRNETVMATGDGRRSPRILRGIRWRGGAGRDQFIQARQRRVADDASSGWPDRRAGRGSGFAAVIAAVELAAAKPGRPPHPPCTNPPPS
jgi:hypothetical protein